MDRNLSAFRTFDGSIKTLKNSWRATFGPQATVWEPIGRSYAPSLIQQFISCLRMSSIAYSHLAVPVTVCISVGLCWKWCTTVKGLCYFPYWVQNYGRQDRVFLAMHSLQPYMQPTSFTRSNASLKATGMHSATRQHLLRILLALIIVLFHFPR